MSHRKDKVSHKKTNTYHLLITFSGVSTLPVFDTLSKNDKIQVPAHTEFVMIYGV